MRSCARRGGGAWPGGLTCEFHLLPVEPNAPLVRPARNGANGANPSWPCLFFRRQLEERKHDYAIKPRTLRRAVTSAYLFLWSQSATLDAPPTLSGWSLRPDGPVAIDGLSGVGFPSPLVLVQNALASLPLMIKRHFFLDFSPKMLRRLFVSSSATAEREHRTYSVLCPARMRQRAPQGLRTPGSAVALMWFSSRAAATAARQQPPINIPFPGAFSQGR